MTIHARPAASSTTISSAVRPDGNASVIVRSHCGPLRGRALLVERLALSAVDVALQHDRTIADAAERAGRDREVVADEVELGEFGLGGEIQFVGMGNPDLAPLDGEQLGCFFLRHDDSLLHLAMRTAARAGQFIYYL